VKWEVDLHDDFVPEYRELHKDVQDELLANIELLEHSGPQLGRPRADTLNGSRHANMKELRFDAADGVWLSLSTLIERPFFWCPVTSLAAAKSDFTGN
jgi:hypothetical protein